MTIPHLGGDSTAAFLAEGYLFGHRRFQRLRSDAFRTRLLGRPVRMVRGRDAVRAFYEGDRFTRKGAVPRSVVHSLQDVGSVQTLTGVRHHDRKSLFTTLLDADGGRVLAHEFADRWDAAWAAAARGTAEPKPLDLRTLSAVVLTEASLRWLGIPEPRSQREALASQCLAMIDGAGSFGPRNWVGRFRRLASERWAAQAVTNAGRGPRPDAPAAVLARRLSDVGTEVAARELLNLIRPTVAVSQFIVFAALALHLHPGWRQRIENDPSAARPFAQEVRRTTPFFPAIGGIAMEPGTLGPVSFNTDEWVVVDLFATDRHPLEWRDAWTFEPSRFEDEPHHAVVAQGAGDYARSHHCPGEPATVDILAIAVERLARAKWDLLRGDHRVDLRRLPARTADPVRIEVSG